MFSSISPNFLDKNFVDWPTAMASSSFAVVPPKATLELRPFTVHVPEKDVESFKTLLDVSKVGPKTFENTENSGKFGTQRKWLQHAK